MLDRVIAAVTASRKYAAIDAQVTARVCEESLKKYPKWKDAVKAAKNELHIMHESFLTDGGYKAAYAQLENGLPDADSCRSLLMLHASTKERAEYAEQVCEMVSQYFTEQDTLCDVGCGFNPFTLPLYAHLPAKYFAYDISTESAALINRYFGMLGRTDYRAEILDAVTAVPAPCDLMLAYKILPLLEQQKKARAMDFLSEAPFRRAVISFPLKTLSGRERGMQAHYSAFFEEQLPEKLQILQREIIGNELFYVVKRA
ncbi:MAG: hypothetical protein IK130_12235 [Oscillospiraceae bacterium]|nr:hypothetical protein [Oscillospiraceae bacterium]